MRSRKKKKKKKNNKPAMKNPALGNNGVVEVGVGCNDGNAVAGEGMEEIVKKMNLEEVVEEDEEEDEERREKVREGNERKRCEENLIGRNGIGGVGAGGIHENWISGRAGFS